MSEHKFPAFSSNQRLQFLEAMPVNPVILRVTTIAKDLPILDVKYKRTADLIAEKVFDDDAVNKYIELCAARNIAPLTTLTYTYTAPINREKERVDISVSQEHDSWINDVIRNEDTKNDIKEKMKYGFLHGLKPAEIKITNNHDLGFDYFPGDSYKRLMFPIIKHVASAGYDIGECEICLKTYEGSDWDSGVRMYKKRTEFFDGQTYERLEKADSDAVVSLLEKITKNSC